MLKLMPRQSGEAYIYQWVVPIIYIGTEANSAMESRSSSFDAR